LVSENLKSTNLTLLLLIFFITLATDILFTP
jgi:hypothetical protein